MEPDPAKLLQAQVTVPGILDAVAQQHDRFARADREQSRALADAGERPDAQSGRDLRTSWSKTTPGRRARSGSATSPRVRPSVMPVYTMVTANGKPAVLLNIFRQPDSNTVAVADLDRAGTGSDSQDAAPGREGADVLRSVAAGARFHHQRSRRDSDRPGSGGDHSGSVPARLGQFAGRGAGDSRDHRHHADRAAPAGRKLQPDDAGRTGGGRRTGDRRRHRGGGEHRAAPRFRPSRAAKRSAARCARFACRWWDRPSRRSSCFFR